MGQRRNLTNFWVAAGLAVGIASGMPSAPALAFDDVTFSVTGADDGLTDDLRAASLLLAAKDEGRTDPRDLLATSLAEYERLLGALYAKGFYGPVINVRVDGREAATIESFDVPDRISQITVTVDPGDQFTFGTARVAPMPSGRAPIDAFRPGEPAEAEVIREAARDVIETYRERGRAKADVAGQRVVANHALNLLNAEVMIDPGPVVTFGNLNMTTPSYVRAARIRQIAGLPTGEQFSPEELDKSAERLRRTGAFASVSMIEGPLGAGDTMDIDLAVADMKPRRFGFGAELSSLEGVGVSAFWLHRNLLGGAERFRIDGAVSGLTTNLGNLDAEVDARLDIPAAFGTDTDAFVSADADYLREPTFTALQASAAVGVHRYFTNDIEGEIGLGYMYSRVDDSKGRRSFSMLQLPTEIIWDRRNDPLNPVRGFYLGLDAEPFYEFTNGPGVWGLLDGRIYKGFGEDEDVVAAARVQVGSVFGPSPAQTHPEYLFYSGGGGTVRGHPYQSLAFPTAGGQIGGQAFAGAQFEVRYSVTDTIGVVGFYDVGYIAAGGFGDPNDRWHSGAGLGLRYNTGLGPIRLDVALPVTGPTGDGVQLYLGIGQSF